MSAKNRKTRPHARNLSTQQRLARYEKNGITVKDLDRNVQEAYQKGYTEGWAIGSMNAFQHTIAAMCLSLNRLYKFGRKRVLRVLHSVDRDTMYELTSEDMIQEVWDKLEIKLEFNDEFDRIKEVVSE